MGVEHMTKRLAIAMLLIGLVAAGALLAFWQSGVVAPPAADVSQGQNLRSYFRRVQSAALVDGGRAIVTVAWKADEEKSRLADAPVEVRRWDGESGRLISSLDLEEPAATHAILSPDGGRMALLSAGGLDLYSSTSGERLQQIPGAPQGAAFSPDGKLLAVFRGASLDVFDADRGKLLRTISHQFEVSAACFDDLGEFLLSGSSRGLYFDGPGEALPDGDVTWTRIVGDEAPVELVDSSNPPFVGGVVSLAVTPDGKRAAVAQSRGVRFFDLLKGREISAIAPVLDTNPDIHGMVPNDPPLVHSVAISPDGEMLAMACYHTWPGEPVNHQVQLFEIESGKHIATFKGHRDLIHSLQFSPDGRLLLAAGSRVQLWKLNDPETYALQVQRRHAIQAHGFFLRSVAFSPDGKTLASCADEGSVKLWNVATGELRQTLDCNQRIDPDYEVAQVVFLPDGERLIFAGGAQTKYGDAWIYDWRRDKLLHRLEGHTEPVQSIALLPDGSRLVTASYDDKAIVWKLQTREKIQTIGDLDTPVTDITVRLSPDGSLLTTRFHPAKLWALPEGRVVRALPRETTDGGFTSDPYAFDFSPDGKTFATGDEQGTISAWDAATGTRIASTHWSLWMVEEVLHSPDGRLLVASGSGHVAIFDSSLPWRHSLSRGSPLVNVAGHKDRVWALAFTRDGRLLATGDQSGLIQIWDVRRR
jgi:WD40 repeat protein